MYKKLIDHEHVNDLIVEANKSDDIYETMEHYKRMSIKSERRKNDYREALLCLGVSASEID